MKDKTTAQLQTELDAIVEWFEGDSIDIDEAVTKYKQGLKLVSELEQRLKTAENTISKISKS